MTTCALCGGSRIGEARGVADQARRRPGGFDLLTCADCDVSFVRPKLAETELGRYYEDGFYGDPSLMSRLALARFMAARRALVARAGVTRGRLLDVGCGAGQFLEEMGRAGFSCVGMEPSAAGRERASAHADVVADLADVPPGPYDCVTLWQALEHAPDPRYLLETIRPLLRADGVLVVAVPNAKSVESLVFGERWFHLDVPRHQWHFSKHGLARLLERTSFEVRGWEHRSMEYNAFGLLQSVSNVFPGENNALYKLLKGGRAFRSFDALTQLALSMTLLALPVGATLAAGADLALAAFERAGTMTAVASPAMMSVR